MTDMSILIIVAIFGMAFILYVAMKVMDKLDELFGFKMCNACLTQMKRMARKHKPRKRKASK
jgi:hypothetical protein